MTLEEIFFLFDTKEYSKFIGEFTSESLKISFIKENIKFNIEIFYEDRYNVIINNEEFELIYKNIDSDFLYKLINLKNK